jgi:hypothetical protein
LEKTLRRYGNKKTKGNGKEVKYEKWRQQMRICKSRKRRWRRRERREKKRKRDRRCKIRKIR